MDFPNPTSKPPTQIIIDQQEQVRQPLPFGDETDFVNAGRGLEGRMNPNIVENADGEVVWNIDVYEFLQHDSPDSANPSLWRQSKLAHIDGLFKVTDRIYQVRGLDLSNVTVIEGEIGLIIIDPLTSKETGAAALALYQEHLDPKKERPIKAIIYTHSHVDHFGGVKGFVSEEEVEKNDVKSLHRKGFWNTPYPRMSIQVLLWPVELHTFSTGEVTLIAPNDIIKTTNEQRTIDGVEIAFQMAPDTEAPSEMLFFFAQFKALCAAEDATHTFHNLLTLRGAVVRDPHGWSKYLTETIDLFGGKAEVVFASQHWPTWGAEQVTDFLTSQRDLYAYVHDRTLRLLNKGYNGPEIAEMMTLPPALDKAWGARGYYGSVNHNVKAVYQRYVGWFDGNPSHLWKHVPTERAQRYVQLAGGMKLIPANGSEAFDTGDFRCASELINHAVFAEPDNTEARELLADIYEQLGYGSENGTWRNFFISGTTELRAGNFGMPTLTASPDVVWQLTSEMLFDSLAIQINGPEAWDKTLAVDIVLTDTNVTYRLWLSNAALVYSMATQSSGPQVTLTSTTKQLPALAGYGLEPDALREAGITIEGDQNALSVLSDLLDPGDPSFNIVTP
ncbi:Alkyl/aryl-sulfatase BDS1 [Fusarium oxysporum]|uniref:Alkyl/aryl-sulfatase BDS1 n=1 Tax=Fusarium oxysporum TaxID=5507 RepID=A0A420MG40_FUSOX|nr:Alkyl/aryl-sulfatase BDS1 [Fusarium oxysporum]